MKRRIIYYSIGFVLLFAFFYTMPSGFGPDYSKAEIKQGIGGVLLCNAVHNADHQTWQYDVNYKYKDINGSIYDIGNGTYYGREWNKDEQLLQYKNWTILKTGGQRENDKVIIGDLNTKKWTEYEFTPENIEKDSLWQITNTHSLLNYCCSEAFIDRIDNGQIVLHYKFRTSENKVNEYGQKEIYYIINELSGQPILKKVQ